MHQIFPPRYILIEKAIRPLLDHAALYQLIDMLANNSGGARQACLNSAHTSRANGGEPSRPRTLVEEQRAASRVAGIKVLDLVTRDQAPPAHGWRICCSALPSGLTKEGR